MKKQTFTSILRECIIHNTDVNELLTYIQSLIHNEDLVHFEVLLYWYRCFYKPYITLNKHRPFTVLVWLVEKAQSININPDPNNPDAFLSEFDENGNMIYQGINDTLYYYYSSNFYQRFKDREILYWNENPLHKEYPIEDKRYPIIGLQDEFNYLLPFGLTENRTLNEDEDPALTWEKVLNDPKYTANRMKGLDIPELGYNGEVITSGQWFSSRYDSKSNYPVNPVYGPVSVDVIYSETITDEILEQYQMYKPAKNNTSMPHDYFSYCVLNNGWLTAIRRGALPSAIGHFKAYQDNTFVFDSYIEILFKNTSKRGNPLSNLEIILTPPHLSVYWNIKDIPPEKIYQDAFGNYYTFNNLIIDFIHTL